MRVGAREKVDCTEIMYSKSEKGAKHGKRDGERTDATDLSPGLARSIWLTMASKGD